MARAREAPARGAGDAGDAGDDVGDAGNARDAPRGRGHGGRLEGGGEKNAERDGEGEVVEAAGEKRKRADALLSLNDSEADPGARGMDLDR